jgi:hypothetical protein
MAYFYYAKEKSCEVEYGFFLTTAKNIDPKEYVSWIVMLSEAKRRLNKLFGSAI